MQIENKTSVVLTLSEEEYTRLCAAVDTVNWSECDPAIGEFFTNLTGVWDCSNVEHTPASGKGITIVEDEDD